MKDVGELQARHLSSVSRLLSTQSLVYKTHTVLTVTYIERTVLIVTDTERTVFSVTDIERTVISVIYIKRRFLDITEIKRTAKVSEALQQRGGCYAKKLTCTVSFRCSCYSYVTQVACLLSSSGVEVENIL